MTTANISPRSGVSIFLTVYMVVPPWFGDRDDTTIFKVPRMVSVLPRSGAPAVPAYRGCFAQSMGLLPWPRIEPGQARTGEIVGSNLRATSALSPSASSTEISVPGARF